MTDREKVIKGLECCLGKGQKRGMCEDCPYDTNTGRMKCNLGDMHVDALTLLKAQEPRTPHYTILHYIIEGNDFSVKHPECPKCYENGLTLWDAEIERGAAYCKRCGQAVKWE